MTKHRAGQVRTTTVRAADLLRAHVTERVWATGPSVPSWLASMSVVRRFGSASQRGFVVDVGRAMAMVGARDEAR